MKNRIIFSCLAFTMMGLVFFSCSDDFLDTPPQGTLDQATLASGVAGVETSLISAYKSLHGWTADWSISPWGATPTNVLFGSFVSDDAYTGTEPTDGVDQRQLELYQWTSSNPNLNPKFVVLYEGIARANATIKLANGLEDQDEATRIKGEATFLRAHFHFDGWKLWKNIPYYTEEDTDFRKTNTEDVFPRIVADLESAISMLPETQDEVGRVDKVKAQAYLGRVLLYGNDFSKAKQNFDAVVNSGRYSLHDCFHKNFLESEENRVESIFAIQFSVNDGTTDGDNARFTDRLGMPHGGSPFGCCGFHQPSQNLVNVFKVDGDGLPLFDSFNDSELTDADPVDPRIDWTVARPGVPCLNWGLYDDSWVRSLDYSGPYSAKKPLYPDGAAFQSGTWSGTQLHGANADLVRYGDLLLMLAECEVELGDLERARELVNMVRSRAGNCAQGPDGAAYMTTLDDPGITWANYQVGTYDSPWSDATAARRAVRMERRLELAMEGWRWFDLVRWGQLETVMNDYFAVERTRREHIDNANPVVESKHNLYPLPNEQVQLSSVGGVPQIQQNPGY